MMTEAKERTPNPDHKMIHQTGAFWVVINTTPVAMMPIHTNKEKTITHTLRRAYS